VHRAALLSVTGRRCIFDIALSSYFVIEGVSTPLDTESRPEVLAAMESGKVHMALAQQRSNQ